MAAVIKITWDELDAAGLRRATRRASSVAASRRMLALALVLEGNSRTEAAQAAGMDRQTLRDWVHRYNEEGLFGLSDRHGEFGPKRLLVCRAGGCSRRVGPVRAGPGRAWRDALAPG